MTLLRGSNPIWFEVDLTAHAFDDTFYLFVLENEIPYIPETVWQDPFGNDDWTNPIRFLANGTLPNNIYFDSEVTYRLEFRQGPTQQDPLIYLVENYMPGTGMTPIPQTNFPTDNQITNPQFALIDFGTPANPTLSLTSISTQEIQIGPGWYLNLTGIGNVTLTQVPLNSTATDPTNAPYALQIQLSGGWNKAYIRQRFQQNGILWSNTYVSSSITASSSNTPTKDSISAILVDSQGHLLTTVLHTTLLTSSLAEYQDVGEKIAASSNTDFPPVEYIEYQLNLPVNANVFISSIQLVSGNANTTYPYEQTTIERQIDQTYNTAYPIVPVGTVIDFGGFTTPLHYLLCDYGLYNRIAFNLLFQAITTTETVTLSSGTATFTVADGTKYRVGMGLENAGIPANTTIIGISTNTITMSSAATTTGSTSVRFFAAAKALMETVTLTMGNATFTVASGAAYAVGMALTGNGIPANTTITVISVNTITMSNTASISGSSLVSFYSAGNGDGSSTFNVYDLRDFVVAGSGGSLFGAAANGLGANGGSATTTLVNDNLPAHTHNPLAGIAFGMSNAAGGSATAAGTGVSFAATTGVNTTTNTPVSIVQQTMLLKKYIRYE